MTLDELCMLAMYTEVCKYECTDVEMMYGRNMGGDYLLLLVVVVVVVALITRPRACVRVSLGSDTFAWSP